MKTFFKLAKKYIIYGVLIIALIVAFFFVITKITSCSDNKKLEKLEEKTAKVDSDIRVDSTLRDFNAEKRAYSDSCNAELQYKYNKLYQRLESVSDKFNSLAAANKDSNCVELIKTANEKFHKYDTAIANRNNYIANLKVNISAYKEDSASYQKNLLSLTSNRDSWKKIAEKPKQKSVVFVSSGLNSFGYGSLGAGYIYNHAGFEVNYLTNINQHGVELKGILKF